MRPFFLGVTVMLAAALAACHEKPPKPSVTTGATITTVVPAEAGSHRPLA